MNTHQKKAKDKAPGFYMENPMPVEADAIGSRVIFPARHEFASPESAHLPVDMEARRKFYPYRASGASRSLDADTESKSNQEAAERIEQLRQAVYELTSKRYAKSSEQERAYEETQLHQHRQTAPPPAQPVVIINRFASQVRTPCAFWERSYLGRFRLRSLR